MPLRLASRWYVQSHPLPGTIAASLAAVRRWADAFDGVAAKELLADEERFIDLANSPIWVFDEEEFV